MNQCWNDDPENRPHFTTIQIQLENFYEIGKRLHRNDRKDLNQIASDFRDERVHYDNKEIESMLPTKTKLRGRKTKQTDREVVKKSRFRRK